MGISKKFFIYPNTLYPNFMGYIRVIYGLYSCNSLWKHLGDDGMSIMVYDGIYDNGINEDDDQFEGHGIWWSWLMGKSSGTPFFPIETWQRGYLPAMWCPISEVGFLIINTSVLGVYGDDIIIVSWGCFFFFKSPINRFSIFSQAH